LLTALALNLVGTASGLAAEPEHPWSQWIGWIGLADSTAGFAACGFLMLVLFVFFRIGGGDVKLLAMLGAFLGLEQGIQTLLWTFVLGGAMGLIILIWRLGPWRLLMHVAQHVSAMLRLGRFSGLTDEERQQLQPPLFLAPTALVALLIVRFSLVDLFIDWTRGFAMTPT